MTVSRVSRWLLCAAGVTAFSAAPAWAQLQTGQDPSKALPSVSVTPSKPAAAPKTLVPAGDDAAKAAPRPDTPRTFELRIDPRTGEPLTAEEMRRRENGEPMSLTAPARTDDAAADKAPPPNAGARPAKPAKGLVVQTLGDVDPASVGLLEPADGGLGPDMWDGMSRALVGALLDAAPIPASSPVMRDLMRRLLLTTAHVPSGEGGGDLLALRLRRLVEGGWHRDGVNLLRQLSPGSIDAAGALTILDSLLLQGNVRDACQTVRNNIGAADSEAWLKAAAFCLAVEGKTAQAELYEQLLRENGIEDKPFFLLLASLTGREAGPVASLPRPRPLHLAMLRAARKAVPDDVGREANPAVLRSIATTPNATLQLRLEAAEAAHNAGLLEIGVVRRIYASVPFNAAERADALAQATARDPAMASALLYQVAQIESQPNAKARVIQAALQRARAEGRYFTVAAANLDSLMAMQPEPALAWFAADAGRALLLAGEWQRAREWLLAMLETAKNGDEPAVSAVLQLAPLLFVGDPGRRTGASADALLGWWRAEVEMARPSRYQRAGLLFGAMEAFDQPVPGALWDDLLVGPPVAGYLPASGVLRRLEAASSADEVGKTVLLSLLALGPEGPSKAAPAAVAGVVRALRGVGLISEARGVALEAMVGQGF
jgi:hypothetical protein